MTKIRLESTEGVLVKEGLIPEFVVPPQVIFWGIRTFMKYNEDTYREVFAFTLLP